MNLTSENLTVRKKTVDYLVRAVQYAEELGAPLLSFHAGWVPLDKDVGTAWGRAVESLRYLSDVADAFGRKIAVCVAGDRKESLLDQLSKTAQMREEVGSPVFGFAADTVCLTKMGVTAEEFCETLGSENISLLYVADSRNLSARLAPGEGNLDLETMLDGFGKCGFSGYLSMNMRGNRDGYVYEEEPERCMRAGTEWMKAYFDRKEK